MVVNKRNKKSMRNNKKRSYKKRSYNKRSNKKLLRKSKKQYGGMFFDREAQAEKEAILKQIKQDLYNEWLSGEQRRLGYKSPPPKMNAAEKHTLNQRVAAEYNRLMGPPSTVGPHQISKYDADLWLGDPKVREQYKLQQEREAASAASAPAAGGDRLPIRGSYDPGGRWVPLKTDAEYEAVAEEKQLNMEDYLKEKQAHIERCTDLGVDPWTMNFDQSIDFADQKADEEAKVREQERLDKAAAERHASQYAEAVQRGEEWTRDRPSIYERRGRSRSPSGSPPPAASSGFFSSLASFNPFSSGGW